MHPRRYAFIVAALVLGVGQLVSPGMGAAEPAPVAVAPTNALALTLGTALPDSGPLSSYGPATQAAVLLAVEDANRAGGVLGQPVTLVPADSGHTGSNVFARTLATLSDQGAQAIVGPMSSELVLDNLDAVLGRALVSPAVSSPLLDGVLSHVSPTTTLEGAMLAKLASQADVRRVVIVASRAERAVAEVAADEAESRGMRADIVLYSSRQSATKVAAKIYRTASDGLILAGDGKTTAIVRQLLSRGMPGTVLLTSWTAKAITPRQLPPRALEGALTVEYDLAVPRSLKKRLAVVAPDAKQLAYSPQAYDSAAIAILAAEQSGRFLGEVTVEGVRSALPSVTSGGVACTTLQRCLDLLGQGKDIAYVGLTGPVDLTDGGEPQAARYLSRTFDKSNKPGKSTRAVRFP